MKLEYTLTLKDYKAAFKLHRRQKVTRRLMPWIGPILLLLSLVGFIVFSMNRNLELAAQSMALGAGSAVLTIGAPISRFFKIRRSYRQLFPSDRNDRSSSIEIDDERILRKLSGLSELKILWSGVYGFAQDETVTLIYTNRNCFLLFPTQLMTPQERTELNDLITRHGLNK